MKTKWLLFLLLIPLFACTTQSTSPLSKAEKDKIQGEVKAAANEIRKACIVLPLFRPLDQPFTYMKAF